LDQPVLQLLPSDQAVGNVNRWKAKITLQDVLTMSSGFQWDEWTTGYGTPHNPIMRLIHSEDWVQFVLNLPVSQEPGAVFTYNSGNSILLAGVLHHLTGENAADYAQQRLFSPLGITTFAWEMGPHEINNTAWGLNLRPRDMAVIGQLILNGGMWGENRILPEA